MFIYLHKLEKTRKLVQKSWINGDHIDSRGILISNNHRCHGHCYWFHLNCGESLVGFKNGLNEGSSQIEDRKLFAAGRGIFEIGEGRDPGAAADRTIFQY